ncbi:hypothetical protein JCGZ_24143 [Jatropha curcas]|uniref:Uncharacterized protein n=1 Tax=Jatropha curcas TaxID=180498 RepID=A0A067LGK1_JATCU|nr:hypothetical protein JCGZ_24143 [Jatropha curcas]
MPQPCQVARLCYKEMSNLRQAHLSTARAASILETQALTCLSCANQHTRAPPQTPLFKTMCLTFGKGTRIDINVMPHMKTVEKIGDMFSLVRRAVEDDDESDHEEGDDTNMEEDIPHSNPGLGTFSSAGTSGAGPSFQGTFDLSNEEVLVRMMSRMDIFDACFQEMETMISDRF